MPLPAPRAADPDYKPLYDWRITLRKAVVHGGVSALIILTSYLGAMLADQRTVVYMTDHFPQFTTWIVLGLPMLGSVVTAAINWLKQHDVLP